MFTGIVEATGTITAVTEMGARAQITVSTPGWGDDLQHGESIAVDGVCLTVAQHEGGSWVADVMRITLETTTLGAVEQGKKVNLERAMRADGRLGGHFLQGHVDGVAELVARDSHADWDDLTFDVPEALAKYVVAKGSIALNGTSLTVAAIDGTKVTVSLIPTTLADTTFGGATVGTRANVEVDVIGKYVEKLLGDRS